MKFRRTLLNGETICKPEPWLDLRILRAEMRERGGRVQVLPWSAGLDGKSGTLRAFAKETLAIQENRSTLRWFNTVFDIDVSRLPVEKGTKT